MDPEPGAVLTIEELAEYLKISKSTLYKLAQVHGYRVAERGELFPAWRSADADGAESVG